MKNGKDTGRWQRAALLRAALLAGVWVLVAAEDSAPSALFGLIAVVLATAASLVFSPPAKTRVAVVEAARYAAAFVHRSLLAGIDVARRALDPRLPIDPAWRHYTLRLPPGPARIVLLGTVTLLPGTLSAEIEDGELWVHVLDASLPVDREFAEWEQRVARLFRLDLHDHGKERGT